jgi:molybdopterin synthase sulfur carrier subunit
VAVVWIPALLRDLTSGSERVVVEAGTVAEALEALELRYPGFSARICEDGQLRPTMNVVVDGTISRQKLRQRLAPDSEVHFLPAISGGSCMKILEMASNPGAE